MIHFTFLEGKGLALAAMSDKSDGDCGIREEAQVAADAFLHQLDIKHSQLIRLRQVHGRRIVDAAEILGSGEFPEADGVVTNRPGVALGISVADCAPVLLFNPEKKTIAALHAGREGIRLNIAAAGIKTLCETYGGSPEQLVALVGPCAGPCCYEVSPELAEAWTAAGLPAQGRTLQLARAISGQLENAGVIRHNIRVMPHCTVCGGGFYSYRADKTANRNLVIVML